MIIKLEEDVDFFLNKTKITKKNNELYIQGREKYILKKKIGYVNKRDKITYIWYEPFYDHLCEARK